MKFFPATTARAVFERLSLPRPAVNGRDPAMKFFPAAIGRTVFERLLLLRPAAPDCGMISHRGAPAEAPVQ